MSDLVLRSRPLRRVPSELDPIVFMHVAQFFPKELTDIIMRYTGRRILHVVLRKVHYIPIPDLWSFAVDDRRQRLYVTTYDLHGVRDSRIYSLEGSKPIIIARSCFSIFPDDMCMDEERGRIWSSHRCHLTSMDHGGKNIETYATEGIEPCIGLDRVRMNPVCQHLYVCRIGDVLAYQLPESKGAKLTLSWKFPIPCAVDVAVDAPRNLLYVLQPRTAYFKGQIHVLRTQDGTLLRSWTLHSNESEESWNQTLILDTDQQFLLISVGATKLEICTCQGMHIGYIEGWDTYDYRRMSFVPNQRTLYASSRDGLSIWNLECKSVFDVHVSRRSLSERRRGRNKSQKRWDWLYCT